MMDLGPIEFVVPAFRQLSSVLAGGLNENKDDVKWKQLPGLKSGRSDHSAFYLNDRQCIVGGMDDLNIGLECCEIYDLANKTWSSGPSLPYAILHLTAITDRNGKFALIIGIESGESKIFIFDDENGFYEAQSTNVDLGIKPVVAVIQ